jgi:NADH dehydrogenase
MIVGAGFAGYHPGLGRQRPRWLLLNKSSRVLHELDEHLSHTAEQVLRGRGVDLRPGVSVAEATPEGVRLTDSSFVATRSLIWCVGVRPDPLVETLGLETINGRLVVDEYLNLPGHPEV